MGLKTCVKKVALSLYPGQLFAALDKPIDFALKRVSRTIYMLNNQLYSMLFFRSYFFKGSETDLNKLVQKQLALNSTITTLEKLQAN